MNSGRGFTLLEVMISLAVVGGLLVTLIYTLNYHLAIAGRHEFLTVASILARDKIGEMERKPVAAKGDFPAPHEAYHFETDVKDSAFPGIAEISVIVKKDDDKVTMSQLIEKGRAVQ